MAESDPASTLPDRSGSTSRRGAKRDSLLLLAHVRDEQGRALGRVRVRNLSATGLMADSERPCSVGQRLVFDLRGVGPVAGAVKWVRGERMGVVFDRTVDPRAARKPIDQNDLVDFLRAAPRASRS